MNFLSQGKDFLFSQKDALQDKIKNEAGGLQAKFKTDTSSYVDGFSNFSPIASQASSSANKGIAAEDAEPAAVSENVKSTGTRPSSDNGFSVLAGNIGMPFDDKLAQAKNAVNKGYDMRKELNKDNLLQKGERITAPYVTDGRQSFSSDRDIAQGKMNGVPSPDHVSSTSNGQTQSATKTQVAGPVDQQTKWLIMAPHIGTKFTQAKDLAYQGYVMKNETTSDTLIQKENGITAPYVTGGKQRVTAGQWLAQGKANSRPASSDDILPVSRKQATRLEAAPNTQFMYAVDGERRLSAGQWLPQENPNIHPPDSENISTTARNQIPLQNTHVVDHSGGQVNRYVLGSPIGSKLTQAKDTVGYDLRKELNKDNVLQKGKGFAAPHLTEGKQFIGRGFVQGEASNTYIPPQTASPKDNSPIPRQNAPQNTQSVGAIGQQSEGMVLGSPLGGKFTQAKDLANKGYNMKNELTKDNLLKKGKGFASPHIANGKQFFGAGKGLIQGNTNNKAPAVNGIEQPSAQSAPLNTEPSGNIKQSAEGFLMTSPVGSNITQAKGFVNKGLSMKDKLNKDALLQKGKDVRASFMGGFMQGPNTKQPPHNGSQNDSSIAPSAESPKQSINSGILLSSNNLGSAIEGKVAKGKDVVAKGKDAVAKGKAAVAKGKDVVAKSKDAVAKGKAAVAKGKDAVAKGKDIINKGTDMKNKLNKGLTGGFFGKSQKPASPTATASPTSTPATDTPSPPGQGTAADNLGADFGMDNVNQKGLGFMSSKTGLNASQFDNFGSAPANDNAPARGGKTTRQANAESVLGMFAKLSDKVDKGSSSKDGSSTTDDSGEKLFVARYEDTRGPSIFYAKGVIVRLLLIALNTFTTVMAINVSNNYFLWGCPPLCAIFLALEYSLVVFKRLGREWTWWLPCLIVYLVTTLPLVCEMQLRNSGLDENGKPKKSDIGTIVVCDATVYMTIFARWMLQGGVLSILSMATVLLDFLANASDIMDLLSLTDQVEVRTNRTLMYWVLIAWSLSFIKFIPLIERKAGDNPKTLPGYIQRSCGPQFTDLLQTLFALILLDGSFLLVRMYLLIAENVVTFSLIFFVVKNVLSFVTQFYHLIGLCRTMPCMQGDGQQEEDPE